MRELQAGADIILLPEIPYDIDVVDRSDQEACKSRISISRSLRLQKVQFQKKMPGLRRKNYKEKLAKRKYPSVAYELAEKIQKKTDQGSTYYGAGTYTERRFSMCV